VLGRGRPIIFLHDWVGSCAIGFLPCKPLRFRSAPTPRPVGFRDSAKNPNYYSVEQQINLLEEFLEEMGIARSPWWTWFGAILAMLYAIRNPGSWIASWRSACRVQKRAQPTAEQRQPADLADWLLGRSPVTEAAWVEAAKADPKRYPYPW